MQLACSICRTYVEIGVGREMRPSLPFICKACRAKSKQVAAEKAGGTEPRSSPASRDGTPPSGAARQEPTSARESERLQPASRSERDGRSSAAVIEPEASAGQAGNGGARRTLEPMPLSEPEQGEPLTAGRREHAAVLASRLSHVEPPVAVPTSGRRGPRRDTLDFAAEAAIEHAVITPDGGLRARDGATRSRTIPVAPRGGRGGAALALSSVRRSPSMLPSGDSDPVSIRDLAHMLSPGIEPPSLAASELVAEFEHAAEPAAVAGVVVEAAVEAPRAVAAAAAAPTRPRASVERRPIATLVAALQQPSPGQPRSSSWPVEASEPPPMSPPADSERPSSVRRSSPELRLEDVQAMAALAPHPEAASAARRALPGADAVQPSDSSQADLGMMESRCPPPLPASTDEATKADARPGSSDAVAPLRSAEPRARSSRPPAGRRAAHTGGEHAVEPGGPARREDDSALLDLRRMAETSEGDERLPSLSELRADEAVMTMNGGLFEGDPGSPSPVLDETGEQVIAESDEDPEDEPPVDEGRMSRVSIVAGSLVTGGRRLLAQPTWRNNLTAVGWVIGTFVIFGIALYFAQGGVKALTSTPAPQVNSAGIAAEPPAAHGLDKEPSLDDDPVAEPAAPAASAPTAIAAEETAPEDTAAEDAGAPPVIASAAIAEPAAAASERAALPAEAPPPVASAKSPAPETRSPELRERPIAVERTRPGAAVPAPAPRPAAPVSTEFDRGAASAALASAAAVAAGCTGEGLTGSARVAVTFGPAGKVTSARVEAGDLAGTATGGCIAGAFRGASVPPFEGSPVTVLKQVNIR